MNDRISSHQLTAVLLPLIFTPMMMNFSRLVYTETGRGSWLTLLLIALGTWLLSAAIIKLYSRFPATVLENGTLLWGRKITSLFLFAAALLFLLFSAAALNVEIYVVKLFFLPRTPELVIALLLFLPAIAMTCCGLRSYTYMATLLLPALMLFLTMFLFTKHNYRPEELFPLGEFRISEVLAAVPKLFLTAPGIAATFFILPYVTDNRHLYRKAAVSALLVFVLGLFVYAMALMYFGGNTLTQLILPFYNLSSIFKGTLAERMDILFMITILPAMMVCNGFGITAANLILKNQLLKTYARRKFLPLILMTCTILSVALFTSESLPLWTLWQFCNTASLFLILLLLLLTAWANHKRRRISK